MNIDLPYLLFATIASVVSIGVFLIVYDWMYGIKLLRSWTFGALCLVCALGVQHVRLSSWRPGVKEFQAESEVLVLIPVLLFAVGSLCYWCGLRRILRQATAWRTPLVLGCVLLAGIAAYLYGVITPMVLNSFRDGFVATVYGFAAVDILRSSAAGAMHRGKWVFGGFSGSVSLAFWVCAGLRFLPSVEELELENGVLVVIILTVCSGIFSSALFFTYVRSAKIASLHELAITREKEASELRVRQNIGRALHDSIAGANTCISLLATRAATASSIEDRLKALEQISSLSCELGDDLHFIMAGLEGASISSRRWLGEVRHYATGALDAAGISCKWTAVGFDERPLGEVLAVRDVQRSLKEVVHNLVRHSRASTASFALEARDERLTIWIEDDGEGIPPDRPAGRGLAGLRTSAAGLGGFFGMESSVAGTSLRFELPLPLARKA